MNDTTPTRAMYLMHFDGADGTFTLEREVVGGIRAASRVALEIANGRTDCFVRGVERLA